MSKPDALARIERDDELCVTDVQESLQTRVPDSQKPPQTVVPDGQKPPQTPEETNQKEEALGEDKVPAEGDTGELRRCQDLLPRAVPVPGLSDLPAVAVGVHGRSL